MLKPIFGEKLSPDLIHYVGASKDRPDIDISKPKPLIPDKKGKKRIKIEPEQEFLVISLGRYDREKVFEGFKEKKYDVIGINGQNTACFIRKLLSKDVPKIRHNSSQTDPCDLTDPSIVI